MVSVSWPPVVFQRACPSRRRPAEGGLPTFSWTGWERLYKKGLAGGFHLLGLSRM
jgi:hypothetical protein